MAVEIERKFLVNGESWKSGHTGTIFKQAYLNSDAERTVRIRIAGNSAFLTIKSKTQGLTRQEFEYPIPVADAEALLLLCETPPLEKYRYRIEYQGHLWEVDEFLGENAGLTMAEIELSNEAENFARPDWLGEEVSADKRYFNSYLSTHPYCRW